MRKPLHDDPILGGADVASETIAIPWTVPAAMSVKGIIHVPAHNTPMKPGSREVLLIAIAKARKWIENVARGQSFAEIARREEKAEWHVHHLAPLAFVVPALRYKISPWRNPAQIQHQALRTSRQDIARAITGTAWSGPR